MRPAYLELRQTGPDTYNVLWKVPGLGDEMRLGVYVTLPEGSTNLSEPRGVFVNGAFIERWTVKRAGGLTGGTIHIDGLSATAIDVLVRVERLDGSTQLARLTPSSPSFVVEATPSKTQVVRSYLSLGVEHILGGVDHLLFVLALLIITRGSWRLIKTVTAFTVAHSITLSLAALGFVRVPSAPVEAVIALSIVFVAAEIVRSRQGRPGLTERAPWVVAFTFGLLHGFGFAGALSRDRPAAARHPARAVQFQCGCRNRATALHRVRVRRRRRRAANHAPRCAPTACVGVARGALRHWQRVGVLAHPAGRGSLKRNSPANKRSAIYETRIR